MRVDEHLDARRGPPGSATATIAWQLASDEHREQLRSLWSVQTEGGTSGWPQCSIRSSAREEELGQLAIAFAPTRDGQALTSAMLVLDPGAAATLAVRSINAFRHYTLKPLFSGRCEHLLEPSHEVIRRSPEGTIEHELRELVPTRFVWKVTHGSTVEMQDVEDHESRRRGGPSAPGWRVAEAIAQCREVGFAVVPKAHQLSVQHDTPATKRATDGDDLRELVRTVATRTRPHTHAPPVVTNLGADPVPLDL